MDDPSALYEGGPSVSNHWGPSAHVARSSLSYNLATVKSSSRLSPLFVVFSLIVSTAPQAALAQFYTRPVIVPTAGAVGVAARTPHTALSAQAGAELSAAHDGTQMARPVAPLPARRLPATSSPHSARIMGKAQAIAYALGADRFEGGSDWGEGADLEYRISLDEQVDAIGKKSFQAWERAVEDKSTQERTTRFLKSRMAYVRRKIRKLYPRLLDPRGTRGLPPQYPLGPTTTKKEFRREYPQAPPHILDRVHRYLGHASQIIDVRSPQFVLVYRGLSRVDDLSQFDLMAHYTGGIVTLYPYDHVTDEPGWLTDYVVFDGTAKDQVIRRSSKKRTATSGLVVAYYLPANLLSYDRGGIGTREGEGEPFYYIDPEKLAEKGIADLSPFVLALGRPLRTHYPGLAQENDSQRKAARGAAFPWFEKETFFVHPFIRWLSLAQTEKVLSQSTKSQPR